MKLDPEREEDVRAMLKEAAENLRKHGFLQWCEAVAVRVGGMDRALWEQYHSEIMQLVDGFAAQLGIELPADTVEARSLAAMMIGPHPDDDDDDESETVPEPEHPEAIPL